MPFISQPNIKREFGFRAAEEIIKRTRKGLDKNGIDFRSYAPYSKAYKESDDFAIYSKTSRVNLKQTGEMHASMRVLSIDPKGVTIGIDSNTQAPKALGHIHGTKTKKGKTHLPRRDFFGLEQKDQMKILKDIIRNRVQVERFTEIFDQLPGFVTSTETVATGAVAANEILVFTEDFEDAFE